MTAILNILQTKKCVLLHAHINTPKIIKEIQAK